MGNPAQSIFKTDILQLHGTGRFNVVTKYHSTCDCNQLLPHIHNDDGPCLAVARSGRKQCFANLTCAYPMCQTFLTNDERCKVKSADVREYYGAEIPGTKGYLPLGPRYVAWLSFRKIRLRSDFLLAAASKRKYVFNAIFSVDTGPFRTLLASVISDKNPGVQGFTHLSEKWASRVNSRSTPQLSSDKYVGALLESVFTLSPAGHNPECFRLYEAVEAGSIPVILKMDLNAGALRCRDALQHWHDAPIVILNSWSELFDTVTKLMEDPEALDEMQIKLRIWYDDHMNGIIREFEDFMIESYAKKS